MRKLLMIILLSLSSNHLFAEEVLYCSSELSTGFIKENGDRVKASFEPERFSVKINDQFNTIVIDDENYVCSIPYPTTARKNFHICNEYSGFSFRYSTETKTFVFIRSSSFGYIYSNKDSDSITIGTCEKF
jgi:hypothetical protein